MARVNMMQKQDSMLGTALPAIGGAALGPVGMVAGSALAPKPGAPIQAAGGGQSSAMARRFQESTTDPLTTLKTAEVSLKQLPENLRQEYAPAIMKARMMAERQQGVV